METDVFQAVADPTRRKILQLLSDQELSIVDITKHFLLSRTAINKHLHVLRGAGLVHSRKVGRETRYELHVMPLKELEDWLSFFDKHWTTHLEKLKAFVEKNETV